MANKPKMKAPFKRKMFEEVLQLRGTSIRKLCNVSSGIGWSEKTIHRALNEGKISPELLDILAKRLDIDPFYLMGKHHESINKITDQVLRNMILKNINASHFPYILSQQRLKKDERPIYDRFLENVLILHDLSPKQFEELPFQKQKEFQMKMEEALCPILIEYFPVNARGEDTYSEIYRLLYDIEDYDPYIVESPPHISFKDIPDPLDDLSSNNMKEEGK